MPSRSPSPSASETQATDQPLRILMVTNLYPEQDSYRGTFVQQLVEALRAAGHQVDVELVAQSRGRLDYLFAVRRVQRRAGRGRYDVVHVQFGMAALAARFVPGIPRVVSLYGSDINVRWKRWVTRLGWGGATRIYVSTRLATAAGEPHAAVIANGVDFTRFSPGSRGAARSELGIGPDERVILFGADPRRRVKGYDLYREVVAALKADGVPAHELILSAPRQPPSRVALKLDAADLLLFTSQRGKEGSPTVVKEAIAMGLPVVSVDVGDVAELLDGVVPSAVVPFPSLGDRRREHAELVGQLAAESARILSDRGRSNGRERIAWLDSAQVAERVVMVYREAIRRATHRGTKGGSASASLAEPGGGRHSRRGD